MSSILDAVNEQYKNSQRAASGNKFASNEERLKKYFTAILPKGVSSGERRIRILPTKDGSTPFKEVYFHELFVDGKWVKLFDPKQDGETSPLNEIYQGLMESGTKEDRDLARQYRARKFYIVKVIDRDNEADGVKFWRFKHNTKQDGIFDKIHPIFMNKGDITDPENGRDLTISIGLTKSNNGKEYSVVKSIIPEDKAPLHANQDVANEWLDDEMEWTDVYSKKPQEYLDIVARGETPKWNVEGKKWYSLEESNEEGSESIKDESAKNETKNKPTMEEELVSQDAQYDEEGDDDLPF